MTGDSDFALVIGINHYPHLRSLAAAAKDAKRVAEWLQNRGGLPGSNIELVVSGEHPAERPILQEVDAAFDRIFAAAGVKAREHPGWRPRRLYVYFAGHGCSQQISHIALLMANADFGWLNRALNATEYREVLATRTFPEQVYFFDCCRNYDLSVRGRGPEWTHDPSAAPIPGLTQVVLYAAGFTEYANERNLIYDERRGLFTEALLEGLNGAAATPQGIVSTGRLSAYVEDRLDALTSLENVRQHMWRDTRGSSRELVIATEIQPWTQQLSVTLPAGTTRVVVSDDRGQPCVTQGVGVAATNPTFVLELAAYTVRAEPSGVSSEVRLLPGCPVSVDLGGAR